MAFANSLYPRTSNARVVSYFDSIDNSTYVAKLSPVRETTTKELSPTRNLNQVKFSMDYDQSPEVKKFFQRSYVSPPTMKTGKVDPRINQVLRNAEQQELFHLICCRDYFQDKQLQSDLIEQQEREQYEKAVITQYKANRQQEQEVMDRQKIINQKLYQNNFDDSLNDRVTQEFGKSHQNLNRMYQQIENNLNSQEKQTNPLFFPSQEYVPDQYEQVATDWEFGYPQNRVVPEHAPNQLVAAQAQLRELYNPANSMKSSQMGSSIRRQPAHQAWKDPLSKSQRPSTAGKYYNKTVKSPTKFNINPKKNLFQEVDLLVIQAKSLFNAKKYQETKIMLEKAIYSEGIEHADVYYLCGEANRRMGHHLIAEQMLLKCLGYEFHSPFTYSSLGFLYRDLGNPKRAIALFKKALDQKAGQTALVAFELAKLIGREGMITESLVYFTKAIELTEHEISQLQSAVLELNLAIRKRSEILMHRSCAYEALGLQEMQARDIIEIAKTDATFRLRYIEEGKKLQSEGYTMKAQKIRGFIAKMDRLMTNKQF